jgi:hypothetical protein
MSRLARSARDLSGATCPAPPRDRTYTQDGLKTDSVYQDGPAADLTFMHDSTIFMGPACCSRPE